MRLFFSGILRQCAAAPCRAAQRNLRNELLDEPQLVKAQARRLDGPHGATTLHWQGKIRGADFQPVTFALTQVRLNDKVDAKGRHFMSVVATLQTEAQAESAIRQAKLDENTVLEHLRRTPGISVANIALNAHWTTDKGAPAKSKVHRL